jgi:hypothetical protein
MFLDTVWYYIKSSAAGNSLGGGLSREVEILWSFLNLLFFYDDPRDVFMPVFERTGLQGFDAGNGNLFSLDL